jgi:hypothetical protein
MLFSMLVFYFLHVVLNLEKINNPKLTPEDWFVIYVPKKWGKDKICTNFTFNEDDINFCKTMCHVFSGFKINLPFKTKIKRCLILGFSGFKSTLKTKSILNSQNGFRCCCSVKTKLI